MTVTMTEDTTSEITSVVLGATYGAWGFHNEPRLMESIMEVLTSDEKREVDASYGRTASPAAEEVREILWNRYSGGGISAIATCNLFYALSREDELGWVRAEAGNYSDCAYDRFFKKVIVPAIEEARLAVEAALVAEEEARATLEESLVAEEEARAAEANARAAVDAAYQALRD